MRMGRIAVAVLATVAMGGANAAFNEGFDNVAGLAASGWVLTNNSTPVGESWFQGNDGVFASQSGAAGSYVGANYLSAGTDTGSISNWLITPVLTLVAGDTLTFYTRTADPGFLDSLEVRFSSGSSSDTASFTSLLMTVGNAANPYSTDWTQYSVALPGAGTGRIAFAYTGNAATANYIGIDTLSVTAVPEPATMALFGLGLAAVTIARRRKTAA